MKNHVLAALLACAAVAPAHAASVITADRMLDVQTGRYVESPAIFVDDFGRISSIADARTVRWGANVKHVDLSGKTLVPGLIDMHTHLGPADIGGYRFLEFTDSFWPSPPSALPETCWMRDSRLSAWSDRPGGTT